MVAAPVRVLLIDDEESFFILLRRMLAKVPAKQFITDWAASYDAGYARYRLLCPTLKALHAPTL